MTRIATEELGVSGSAVDCPNCGTGSRVVVGDSRSAGGTIRRHRLNLSGEYSREGGGGVKRRAGKYNATGIRTPDGYFHSASEYARWMQLKLLERAGQIKKLERQPKFPFVIDGKPVLIRSKGYPNGRHARYTADFAYLENGKRIVEDFKGFDTPDSRLRRAIAETIYGIEIRITVTAKRKTAA